MEKKICNSVSKFAVSTSWHLKRKQIKSTKIKSWMPKFRKVTKQLNFFTFSLHARLRFSMRETLRATKIPNFFIS